MTDIAERLEAFASVWPTAYDSDRKNIALLREAAAEIVRLRGEVEKALAYLDPHLNAGTFAAPDWAIQLASILTGGDGCGNPIAPAEAKDPAPAMPNGVEGLLSQARAVLERFRAQDDDAATVINRIDALRAADNRDAAGVSDDDFVHPEYIRGFNDGAKTTPAAVPAGETNGDAPASVLEHLIFSVDRVANSGDYGLCDQAVVQLNYAIEDARRGIGTGTPQPADGEASMFAGQSDAQIAHAVRMAEQHYRSLGRDPVYCNVSLSVLRDCTPPAPVQAAPQEGEDEDDTEPTPLQIEYARGYGDGVQDAEKWQAEREAAHPSACELGVVLVPREVSRQAAHAMKRCQAEGSSAAWEKYIAPLEAALQHRGDSQEVGRG